MDTFQKFVSSYSSYFNLKMLILIVRITTKTSENFNFKQFYINSTDILEF